MREFVKKNQESKDIYYASAIGQKLLCRQIHYDIKNNLNTIASILGLQINSLNKTAVNDPKEILENSKLRIEAIAMIYESLYKNDDTGKVSFKGCVKNLTDLINKAYDRNISIEIESDHISLPVEMMFHMGIIINELFTNSIKYAFEHDKDGDLVKISLSQKEDHYHFIYHESRSGNIDIEKILDSRTLGMRLVKLTVKQMDGVLEVTRNNGLIFTIDL